VLDLGRRPEARFTTGPEYLSQRLYLGKISITLQNASVNLVMKIELVLNEHFIESVVFEIVNFDKWIDMSNCRAVFGTISVVRDLLESEKSILILGKPELVKLLLFEKSLGF
jgi:stage III sporulation protein SpoIIIAA